MAVKVTIPEYPLDIVEVLYEVVPSFMIKTGVPLVYVIDLILTANVKD